MSELYKSLIYWKLAFFKYFSGVLKVGLMAFLGATVSVHWVDLLPFEKFTIICAAVIQMLTYTEGFVDSTASRLTAGKPPVGNGNTDILTKTLS